MFLLVRVRRFRCAAAACPRRTFAEPLSGVALPRARQTDRLRAIHRSIGLALGGTPGSRHAASMGVPIRGVVPAAATETPLFVPVTIAEEPPSASPELRCPAAREAAPGRIEMDLRSGRLVFSGAVDPGLAAAVIAAARGRG